MTSVRLALLILVYVLLTIGFLLAGLWVDDALKTLKATLIFVSWLSLTTGTCHVSEYVRKA